MAGSVGFGHRPDLDQAFADGTRGWRFAFVLRYRTSAICEEEDE